MSKRERRVRIAYLAVVVDPLLKFVFGNRRGVLCSHFERSSECGEDERKDRKECDGNTRREHG
jgi:hypothetical protein